ncbi:MAG: tryptophan--tRNA ligase [Pseudomonadota bacterium]
MKRILSCMQPTNRLHLGNYLGALKNWVALQDEGAECLYGVVDLHAITAGHDPAELAQSTREIAAAYIASGVDPKKSTIFAQSAVPAHAQLMWLFAGSVAQMGKLERMTQFKDKAGKHKERASVGLFAYPVLMAADILIYKATHVPVGEDQKQHLELTREIASSFNHKFCDGEEFFPLPEPVITGEATRVMSLRDGTQKMSKSAESDMTRINLTDDADLIAKKIKKATTDPHPLPDDVKGLEERAEVDNLYSIYAALSGQTKEQIVNEFAGKGFGEFKPALADLCVEKLAPITAKMNELMANPGDIDAVLKAGAEKANALANPILHESMDKMGFWRA